MGSLFKKDTCMPRFFLLFLLFLTSCNLESPRITSVKSIRLHELSNDGAKVKIGIVVSNPNKHTIKIRGGRLEVFVNNSDIGTIDIPDTIELPKNSEELYYLHLQTNYSQIINSLPGFITMFTRKSAEVRVQGQIKAGAYFLRKTFPINVTQNISPDSLKFD